MNFLEKIKYEKAQTIMEYTLVLGIVVVVLMAMTTMVKRGTQGMIKSVADLVGIQKNADQNFESGAYLEYSSTKIQALRDKQTIDFLGSTKYLFNDMTELESESKAKLGHQRQPLP